MFQNLRRMVREKGLMKTFRFYRGAFARVMSINYRQSPERFAQWPRVGQFVFVLFDYARKLCDSLMNHIERSIVSQQSLPREELEEFTIRLLDRKLLSKDSIVYAFGVSRHIETEEDLASRIGCTVHLFDPTKPAIEFMEKHAPDEKLVFDPIGVWTATGPIRFYIDRRSWVKNLSVVNMYHTKEYVEAPCFTLSDIMKRKGHERIDVLKMDIEGSALPVLTHMMKETKLRPRQIVGALERPHFVHNASLIEVLRVIFGKKNLFAMLRKEGYRIITHSAAEFTAVRTIA